MTVTDIVPFDNKRSKIYIDGEFAFILYRGEIRDYKIKTGEEISSPVFDEITGVVIPKRAKLRAMNLLQKRDYTEHKLREKLKEGCYPPEVIDEAVEYLKSYRYLDDERYADEYIRYHMELRSRNRIKQDLLQKGISSDIIERLMDEAYEENTSDPELELCIKLLKKKHYDKDNTTYEEKRKIMALLYRKGFGNSVISSAMSLDIDSI
ncbi:regulatory protein RecX [Butyrivibrio sp. FC2001]|uniref:regulatory protein RecX n=1 Tax=Butyrivibrio sp. FC2001 TaxID=1280671 RepID=UPI000412F115|nr:regulatory protein RecX [Butyrivibrio sp. FC2001]